MKTNTFLMKLLRGAARAEDRELPREEMPIYLQNRVLAALRKGAEEQVLLPIFRAGLAFATVIALLCFGFQYEQTHRTDEYQLSVNYAINSVIEE